MFRLNMILKISPLLIFIALVNIIIFPLIYWQCPMERINKKSERIKRKKKQEKRTQQNKWVIKNNPEAFGPNNPGLGYRCSRPTSRALSLSLPATTGLRRRRPASGAGGLRWTLRPRRASARFSRSHHFPSLPDVLNRAPKT